MFQTNGGVVDSKTAYMLLYSGDVIVLKVSSNSVDRWFDVIISWKDEWKT